MSIRRRVIRSEVDHTFCQTPRFLKNLALYKVTTWWMVSISIFTFRTNLEKQQHEIGEGLKISFEMDFLIKKDCENKNIVHRMVSSQVTF